MIQRRALLAAAVLLLASTTLARADEVEDIVRWLRGLGFDDVSTSRSLLGRVQIRATGAIGTRELVVNPRTGEILRDVWVDADGKVVRGAPYREAEDNGDAGDQHGSDDSGSSGDDNSDHGGGDDGGGDDNSGHGGGDDGGSDGSDSSGSGDGGSDDN